MNSGHHVLEAMCVMSRSSTGRGRPISSSTVAGLQQWMQAFFPPAVPAQLCQRRWDTSPYRRVHRLTWARLNAPRWPYNGSMVWRPIWKRQGPLPFSAQLTASGDSNADWPVGADQTPLVTAMPRSKPELLHRRIHAHLSVSKTEALMLIQRGRVTVNGHLQTRNQWVRSSDEIAVNRHSLEELSSLAILVHKPAGCALTEGDPLKRPTYQSLLPDQTLVARPAGRIDLRASGVLVVTNRRELAAAVATAPQLAVAFLVLLRQPLTLKQLVAMRDPELYGDGAFPEDVEMSRSEEGAGSWSQEAQASLHVVLRGGGSMQLRQALACVGAPTLNVCCVRVGPLSIEDPDMQEPGSSRPLSDAEVAAVSDEASRLVHLADDG
mmetsp:Transcript_781/g.2124  ORF Transcript_781/g.2124 Transcript_781/m.2124 type:complete len:380 (-) Transcript_781:9-1148(-)